MLQERITAPDPERPAVLIAQVRDKELAWFHQFSISHQELNNGVGHYPVAIVEHDDGRVEEWPLPYMRFVSW